MKIAKLKEPTTFEDDIECAPDDATRLLPGMLHVDLLSVEGLPYEGWGLKSLFGGKAQVFAKACLRARPLAHACTRYMHVRTHAQCEESS